jgi:TolA-binding protein
MGLALNSVKQPDRAREAFETLVRLYPDSEMAGLAKQRLAAMARAKPPGRNE